MKMLRWLICLAFLISPVAARFPRGGGFTPFTNVLSIGAGGWLNGIDMADDGSRLARPDTYGLWMQPNASTAWANIINQTSMPVALWGYTNGPGASQAQQDTGPPQEAVFAPSNSSVIYMTQGGHMLKSTNKGTSFVNQTINGGVALGYTCCSINPYRMNGPKGAVDPQNPNVAIFGTEQDGLFETIDGSTWSSISTAQIPKSTGDNTGSCSGSPCSPSYLVAYDRSSATNCGAGTNQTCRVYIFNYVNTTGTLSGYLYVSTTGTSGTFAKVSTAGGPTTAEHIVVSSIGVVWLIDGTTSGSIWSYSGGGSGTFTNFPGQGTGYHSIAVNPGNAAHVSAAAVGGGLNVTTNSGAAWSSTLSLSTAAADIPWLQWTNDTFMSNGAIAYDRSLVNTIIQGAGIGVWTTTEPSTSFTWTSDSKGIEQLVGRSVIAPNGTPIVGVADRGTFSPGTVGIYPSVQNTTYFNSLALTVTSWIDYVAATPSFMVARDTDFVQGAGDLSGTSSDGGTSWTPFSSYSVDVDAATALANDGSNHIKVTVPSTTGLTTWSAGSGSIVRACGYSAPGLSNLNNVAGTYGNNIGCPYFYVTVNDATHLTLQNSSFSLNNLTGKVRIFAATPPEDDNNGFYSITGISNNGSGLIRVSTAVSQLISGGQRACVTSATVTVVTLNGCWILNSNGSGAYDLVGSVYTGSPVYTQNTGVMNVFTGVSGSIAAASTTNYVAIPSNRNYPVCTQDGGQTWTTIHAPLAPTKSFITAATWSGGVATFTTAVAHNLAVNAQVHIANISIAGYNGQFTVASVPTSTSFTVANATSLASAAANQGIEYPDDTGWGLAYYYNRVVVAADRVTANTFYAYNQFTGVYKIVNCTATLVSNGGAVLPDLFTNVSNVNTSMKTVPGNAGHIFFAAGPQTTANHPYVVSLYRSTNGGTGTVAAGSTNWTAIPRVQEPLTFGFGAVAPGHTYPTMYMIGWYDTTGAGNWTWGIWRSTDADHGTPTWTQVGTYPTGTADFTVDITGDGANWNEWYACGSGSGCVFGQQN